MSKAKLFQHHHYRAFKALVEKRDKKAWPEIRKNLVIAYKAGCIPLNPKGNTRSEAISCWFLWSDTPQGAAYWLNLCKTY